MESVQEQHTITKEIHTAVRHSAVYGLGNILTKVLGFLMLPFYTHYLNPADYGVLEILDLSMSLLGMFLNMGMTAAVLRIYGGAKSDEERNKTVSTAFWFVTGTGIVALLSGLALVHPVSAMLFGPAVPSKYLLLAFSAFILGYVGNLPRTYLRALEASGTVVLLDTLGILLLLTLNVFFIAVLKVGLMGILLSSLIVAGLSLVVLSAWALYKVGLGFSSSLLKQMLAFGLPLVFSNMSLFALNFSDRFFLQHLQSLDAVGVYAVGYKFGYMLNYMLVQPFLVMWQSRMFVIHARPDHGKIFGQFFMLYSVLLIYAGLGLAVLSPEIVRLMVVNPSFAASREVIPVVSLAYIFYGLSFYAQVGMFVTNRTKLIGIVGTICAVLNLALNYFLILRFGMLGAAWATMLSFLALAVGTYWLSNRVYPLPLAVGRVGITLMLAVMFYLFSRFSSGSLAVALLVKALLLAAFPLLVWEARILSPEEISTILAGRDSALASVSRMFGGSSGKPASL